MMFLGDSLSKGVFKISNILPKDPIALKFGIIVGLHMPVNKSSHHLKGLTWFTISIPY